MPTTPATCIDRRDAAPPPPPASTRRKVARYLAVGVAAAATDFAVYGALVHAAGVGIVPAHLASRPLGGLVCFWLNRRWTFESGGRAGAAAQLARFWCVWGASYALSTALLHAAGGWLGLHWLAAKALVECIVLTFNFLCLRYWTFR